MKTYIAGVQKLVAGTAVALALVVAPVAAPELSAQARRQGQGQAQAASPEQRVEQRVKQLTKALHLTPQQVDQVRAIMKEQTAAQVAMRGKMQSGDRAAARREMLAQREQVDQKLASVLTADQKTLYAKLSEKERTRRAGGGGR